MKKSIIAFILSICMFACLLTGCKNNQQPETPTEQTQVSVKIPEGKIFKDYPLNSATEKTKLGETTFLYHNLSSVENIKLGNPLPGDVVIVDDIKYIYNVILESRDVPIYSNINGWSAVSINQETKTTQNLKPDIFGVPVKSINYCFYLHKNLTDVKNLPNSVESANSAFESCYNITTVDSLPTSLKNAKRMFAHCEQLKTLPQLPEQIEHIDEMFYYCTNVGGKINIPNSVLSFTNLFKYTTQDIVISSNHPYLLSITKPYVNVIFDKNSYPINK